LTSIGIEVKPTAFTVDAVFARTLCLLVDNKYL